MIKPFNSDLLPDINTILVLNSYVDIPNPKTTLTDFYFVKNKDTNGNNNNKLYYNNGVNWELVNSFANEKFITSKQLKENNSFLVDSIKINSIEEIKERIFVGIINGINTKFTTNIPFNQKAVSVILNRIRLMIIEDYQLSNNNTITLTESPLTGEKLLIYF